MSNTTSELIKYFGENQKVTLLEFREFWESLTLEDKQYYKSVNLQTGLVEAV